MAAYILSREADSDLVGVYEYTAIEFGFRQAESYLETMIEGFERVAGHPFLGRERSDLSAGIRCLVHRSHAIYYRMETDLVVIVRVLHHSMDAEKYFMI